MTYKVILKKRVYVLSREESGYEEARLEFKYDNYDDVQNLIGYLADGSDSVDVQIRREAGDE